MDFKVTLYDGSYHDVDSSEMAFKIAGSMAFKEASRAANPVLLEPMMKVEVEVPEEYMGDVIGDLNRRRANQFYGRPIRLENCECFCAVGRNVWLFYGFAISHSRAWDLLYGV